jgi:hypothetical protein
MAMKKAVIMERVQKCMESRQWRSAIDEMERLYSIDQDPQLRVRIGDVRRKINSVDDAIRDYLVAADLFAERGFIGKALAQYALALRLDATNEYARTRRELLQACPAVSPAMSGPVEYCSPGAGANNHC